MGRGGEPEDPFRPLTVLNVNDYKFPVPVLLLGRPDHLTVYSPSTSALASSRFLRGPSQPGPPFPYSPFYVGGVLDA